MATQEVHTQKPRNQISSINFKKSNAIQTRHNDRDLPPNYLIGGDCEVNRNHQEAQELRNKIVSEAMEKYEQNVGQRFKAKSYEWSAVVNLKPDSTMTDLEKLAKHFNDKYGFQCYQIAIHRDEGHIDNDGKKVINHHAHLEFITLDKNTGKSLFRAELQRPKALRQIQSEVAEILKMERGVDKRLSKTQRIEPRAYAKIAEKQKDEIRALNQELGREKEAHELTKKEINERIEQERKKWIAEQGHTADDYKKLRELLKFEYQNGQELEQKIKELSESLKNASKIIENQKKDITTLQKEKMDLKADFERLEYDLETEKNDLKRELEDNKSLKAEYEILNASQKIELEILDYISSKMARGLKVRPTQESVERFIDDILALKTKNESFNDENKSLKEELEGLKLKIQELESSKSEHLQRQYTPKELEILEKSKQAIEKMEFRKSKSKNKGFER